MTRISLGVGDCDLLVIVWKCVLQRINFSRGTAAPGRCKGLMGHKDQLLGHVLAGYGVLSFHPVHEFFECICKMAHINAGGMECAVADMGA